MPHDDTAVLYVDPRAGDVPSALEARSGRLAVVTAPTVDAALDRVARGGVDCVVTTHREPDLDGVDLVAAVRDAHPDLPVVMYPADGDEAVASRAISAGVTDYVRRGPGDDHASLTDSVLAAVAERRAARGAPGAADERHLKDRAMDAAPVGIVITESDGDDDPMIYVNDGFLRITGYDESEVVGRDCRLLQGEATDPEAVARLREAVEAREPATVVLRNYRNDGTEFWNQVTIAPIEDASSDATHFVGFQQDVTERKERERELQRRNARLERLHEATQELLHAPDREAAVDVAVTSLEEVLGHPVATLWTYDGTREALVPAATTERARELVGDPPTYTEDEGLSWEAFVTDTTRVFDDVSRASGRYNDDTPIRSEIVLPLGEQGVLNIGSTEPDAFDDADRTVAELWAATVSVALARFDHERELRARERELTRERNRLEEFASLVSHDLRNPLNVAEGHLEIARERDASGDLDAVANALDRMEALIEDMLTLARQGSTVDEVEPVALAELARRSWGNVATPNATLRVDTDATVRADRSRLAQVFENLFRNSVEHGSTSNRPGGDEPDDATDDPGDDGAGALTVTVGDLTDGFYVADDGRGIPEAARDRLFEAGYSTSDEGTGFGLKIVRDVVQAHGWTVEATESAAGGARFEVRGVEFDAG
ncbi:MAG: PAS domain-containing protein [Haloferacaceae archaeon]